MRFGGELMFEKVSGMRFCEYIEMDERGVKHRTSRAYRSLRVASNHTLFICNGGWRVEIES